MIWDVHSTTNGKIWRKFSNRGEGVLIYGNFDNNNDSYLSNVNIGDGNVEDNGDKYDDYDDDDDDDEDYDDALPCNT